MTDAATPALETQAVLSCYSAPAEAPDVEITAALRLTGEALRLHFVVSGNTGQILLPPAAPPLRADELWTTTCFEAFLAEPGEPGYLEINLAPRHAWNLYRFDACREGMRPEPVAATPVIETQVGSDVFRLSAVLSGLEIAAGQAVDVNLCAVLEDRAGQTHFYTLDTSHAPPDFHNRASFRRLTTSTRST